MTSPDSPSTEQSSSNGQSNLDRAFEGLTVEETLIVTTPEDSSDEVEEEGEGDEVELNYIPQTRTSPSYNTKISGTLALGLWSLLGLVVVFHFGSVVLFSGTLTDRNNEATTLEKVEAAISHVSETAKTLYAVLTPLATAVTAYYFKDS